jgi:hypothetical protein
VILQAFYSHLSADAGVSALTSSIYPLTISQNASFPAITFEMDGNDDSQLLTGVSSLSEVLIEVNTWDLSHIVSHQLADAVEAALVSYVGDFGALSPSITAHHIRKERRFELYESDTKLFRVSMQFLIAYED